MNECKHLKCECGSIELVPAGVMLVKCIKCGGTTANVLNYVDYDAV